MNIIWLGGVLKYNSLLRYNGVSPAATLWSKGLLNELLVQNKTLTVLAPVWDSLFPKGHIYPGSYSDLDHELPQVLIKYPNIPFIRSKSLACLLSLQILKHCAKNEEKTYVITYNPYSYYVDAVKIASFKNPKISWINLVLDFPDPVHDNWHSFLKATKNASHHIFLSWWAYINAPVRKKLHLDSGWDGEGLNIPLHTNRSKKIFLYSGKISDNYLTNLIVAIKRWSNSDCVFQFFGKGNNQLLKELSREDSRVQLFGFVEDDLLHQYSLNADFFISPRDLSSKETRMIYPSKIMNYLKYKKPVISPRIPGLSPDYYDFLYMLENDTPDEYVKSFDALLSFRESELESIRNKISVFLESRKWSVQVNRVISFLD